MLTLRSLGAAIATLSVGSYAAIVTGVATNIIVARYLGAGGYGRLALLLMVSQVLLTLASAWTLPGLIRFGAQEHALRGTVAASLRSRTVILAPCLILAVLALWAGRAPIAAYVDVPEEGLLVVSVHLLAAAFAQTIGGALQAAGRMPLYGASLFAEKAAALVAILALATLAGPLDAPGVLGGMALAAVTIGGAGLTLIWRAGLLRDAAPESRRLRELWRFSLPQLGGSWAGIFGSQWIDFVIIRQFLTLPQLGLYALAFQIAGTVQQLPVVASTVLLPWLSAAAARGDDREVRSLLGRPARLALVAFATGTGLLLTFADPIVPLIFGETFAEAIVPLSVLLVASCVAAVFHMINPALTARGIVWPVTLAVVAAVATNVAFDLLLIPQHGITGAALATLAAYLVSTGIITIAGHVKLQAPVAGYALFILPVIAPFAATTLLSGTFGAIASLTLMLALAAVLAVAAGAARRADTFAPTNR